MFTELLNGEQSGAQRYFFFAERAAAKIPGLSVSTPLVRVNRAAVIGAGIPVTLIEQQAEFLDRGLGLVSTNWEASARAVL